MPLNSCLETLHMYDNLSGKAYDRQKLCRTVWPNWSYNYFVLFQRTLTFLATSSCHLPSMFRECSWIFIYLWWTLYLQWFHLLEWCLFNDFSTKKHCLPHFNHRKKNSQLLVRPTLRTPGKEQKSSKFDFIISTVDCWIKYDNMVKSIIVASFRSPKTLSKTPSLHGLRLRCHEGHEGRRRWLWHVLYLPNLHRNPPGQLLNW